VVTAQGWEASKVKVMASLFGAPGTGTADRVGFLRFTALRMVAVCVSSWLGPDAGAPPGRCAEGGCAGKRAPGIGGICGGYCMAGQAQQDHASSGWQSLQASAGKRKLPEQQIPQQDWSM
jgi:hypothetical protein